VLDIAHQESPRDNVAVFAKFRKALKPGGALVISDFVLEDDRTGHPFALMFNSTMLLDSKEGSVWPKGDYDAWLREAGFSSITFVRAFRRFAFGSERELIGEARVHGVQERWRQGADSLGELRTVEGRDLVA